MFSKQISPLSDRSRRGFTLIELLMVIAVIGILTGIALGVNRSVQNSQAKARAKAELAIINQGIEKFKARFGDYPWAGPNPGDADQNGRELFLALTGWLEFDGTTKTFQRRTSIPENGPEPFLDLSSLTYVDLSLPEEYNPQFPPEQPPAELLFVDPWGNPYVYLYKDSTATQWEFFGFHLYSKGPDEEDSSNGYSVLTGLRENSFEEQTQNLDNISVGRN